MNLKYKRNCFKYIILFNLILFLFFLTGCASISVSGSFGGGKPDVSATLNIPLTLNQKKQLATDLGIVYVGMPKEDLEKCGFAEHMQKSYYSRDNEEWITYSNWMTEEPGDMITFYLVDGKVRGWE